jgi:sugar lactone lactonase YvrE
MMFAAHRSSIAVAAALIAMITPSVASATPPAGATAQPVQLVAGLAGGSGSTIGPGGALYVTEGLAGRVSRVDPKTGDVTTFASGLPKSIIGIGGAMDVAFIGKTAYVLVTLVGSDLGGSDIVGIYRVDGPHAFTVVADIGAFALSHPPVPAFFIPTGVQYALDFYHGAFLVTDGHHNRVLRVTLDGEVSELIAFDNIVPTGLAVRGNTVYMAEAGPIPHLPQNGKVVSFEPKSPTATEVASGGRLLVDVEFARGHTLYALAQGTWPLGNAEGSPALPNTGSLLRVDADGTFTHVADGLNQPTSLEFIGDTAYVVSLPGEIWKIDNVPGRHAA